MSDRLQKGAAPLIAIIVGIVILLIVVIFVSGGARVNLNVSKNGQSLVDKKTKLYQNQTYGISMNYPGNWRMEEGTTSDPVVSFLSPREGSDDQFTENVNVAVTDLSADPSLSLTQVMDLWVQQNESDPSFSSFMVASRESTSVFGLDAEQVTYLAEGQGLSVKGRTTIFLKESMAYIFTYSAEVESFDTFLGGLETILTSTTIN